MEGSTKTLKMKFLVLCLLSVSLIYCNNKADQVSSEFESLFQAEFKDSEPGGSVLVKKGNEIVYCKSFESITSSHQLDHNNEDH